MTEKDVRIGDQVQLRAPGESLKKWYVVNQIINKTTIQVRDPKDNGLIKVHRSRIGRIARDSTIQSLIKPKGKEENMTEKEAVLEKPAKAKPKAKTKQTAAPTPFDLKAWVGKSGGQHFSKPSEFDHKHFKLVSHMCIDAEAGLYHTINTYQCPDGTVTIGKKGLGSNCFPLKGHKRSIKVTGKNGKEKNQVRTGTKTAEEVIALYEKKGYKKTN